MAGRYITFEALTKIAEAKGWKDKVWLIVGNEDDTKNFRVSDEVLLGMLQEKGLLPAFDGDGDTITGMEFNTNTSTLTITTDEGSFSVPLAQFYIVDTIDERNALVPTPEDPFIGAQVSVRNTTGDDNDPQPKTYRYDGSSAETTWFELGSGSITTPGVDATLTEAVTSNLGAALGGIADGEELPLGMTFTDFVKALIRTVFYPTFTNPSFSLSKSASTLQKIGASVTFNLTFNYSRGAITGALVSGIWNPSANQDFRSGVAIGYTIDGVGQISNVLSVTKTIILGNQSYSGTVTYDEGPSPEDSEGEAYDNPYLGGTSASQSTTIEGVYPLFATTSNIAVATEQSLVSMISGNNIQKTLVAESGGNKQFFDIPNDWLSSRPIFSVQFYNTVSGSFDTTNQLSTFTQSSVTQTVESQTVNYTRFTNNTSDRGATLIKIIF